VQSANNVRFPFQGQFLYLTKSFHPISDNLTSALNKLQLTIPTLLTDNTKETEVKRKYERLRLSNGEDPPKTAIDKVATYLSLIISAIAIAGIASFVFGASLIAAGAIGASLTALVHFTYPLALEQNLNESAGKFGKEVLEVIDFLNDHPEIKDKLAGNSEEAEEFSKISLFYQDNYGIHRFPKISETTKAEFIGAKLPELSLDSRLTHLTGKMSILAILQKYPTAVKIIALMPLAFVTSGLATGIIGTGILPGIALTAAIIFFGASFFIESTTEMDLSNIKNDVDAALSRYKNVFTNEQIMDAALEEINANLSHFKGKNRDTTNLEKAVSELQHARIWYSNPENTSRLPIQGLTSRSL
jgi:hypothetical protein